MADKTKVTLLDDVLLPKEGTRDVQPSVAGDTVELEKDQAERLIELGKAAKPGSAEAKDAKSDDDEK